MIKITKKTEIKNLWLKSYLKTEYFPPKIRKKARKFALTVSSLWLTGSIPVQ